MRKPLIAGNWKMHKTLAEAAALAKELQESLGTMTDIDVVIAPPFTLLDTVATIVRDSAIAVAGQNCYPRPSGAFTGEISAEQLKDCGCGYGIIGHSERRQLCGESNTFINQKVVALLSNGLRPILCIGETLEERESGQMLTILKEQLLSGLHQILPQQAGEVVVAYEPIWAIGTGKTASSAQAEEVHAFVRDTLGQLFGHVCAQKCRILYGGSVKPANIDELMAQPNIDGALVGGASLQAEDFIKIASFTRP